MIEVHLYGKLRRFADQTDPRSASVVTMPWHPDDTVGSLIDRLGIPPEELGSNLFVDGRYANRSTPVRDGARLGLFPDDMQLLYKWYFAPSQGSRTPNQDSAALDEKGKSED